MSKRLQRIGAWMLALSLVLSLLPIGVLAAYTGPNNVGQYVGYNSDGTMSGQKLDESKKVIEEGNLELYKDIEQTGEDTFDITLKVTTTECLEEIPLVQDAAVVLVLDVSSSMEINCSVSGCRSLIKNGEHLYEQNHPAKTRLTALKESAKAFVKNFADPKGEAKRMVAVVAYNAAANTVQNWIDVSTEEGLNTVVNVINNLRAINEGKTAKTNIDAGLQLANNLYNFNEETLNGINQRSAVLMTDGNPNFWKYSGEIDSTTHIGWEDETSTPEAERPKKAVEGANAAASALKNEATLYTMAFQTAGVECYTNAQGKKVTVGEWLKNEVATRPTCYRDALNGEELTFAFEEIAETITNLTAAWKVTDPLGQYVLLENAEEQSRPAGRKAVRVHPASPPPP